MLARHGERAVDVASGRNHREVPQGVCESVEGAQGSDSGSGGAVTGWLRDNARRRLTAGARPPVAGQQVAKRSRRQRKPKYYSDALKVLQKVWAASDGKCGQYLAASMALQLDGLERHDELVFDQDRYSPAGACRAVGDEQRNDRPLPARRQGSRSY